VQQRGAYQPDGGDVGVSRVAFKQGAQQADRVLRRAAQPQAQFSAAQAQLGELAEQRLALPVLVKGARKTALGFGQPPFGQRDEGRQRAHLQLPQRARARIVPSGDAVPQLLRGLDQATGMQPAADKKELVPSSGAPCRRLATGGRRRRRSVIVRAPSGRRQGAGLAPRSLNLLMPDARLSSLGLPQ
jgi:hypothetical protein